MTNNSASPTRSLRRSDDRVLAGVCSGIAEYFGVDVTIVRVVTVLATLFTGVGPLLYAALWVTIPDSRGATVIQRRQGNVTITPDPYAAAPMTPPAAPMSPPAPAAAPADPTLHEPPVR